MLKLLLWIIAIIFIIGLLVVMGVFNLIFWLAGAPEPGIEPA
ncbi:MAG: hypothetical protein ACREV9_07905 [Burkholderiales bacterium]